MDKLEQMKAAHASEDIFNDEVIAKAYVEEFALDTFQRADNAVRANKASAYVSSFFTFQVYLHLRHWCTLEDLYCGLGDPAGIVVRSLNIPFGNLPT